MLCQEREQAYEPLCRLFDEETGGGQDMGRYSELLKQAIESTYKGVIQRNLAQLKQDRGALLIPQTQQPRDVDHFELITWLVIK